MSTTMSSTSVAVLNSGGEKLSDTCLRRALWLVRNDSAIVLEAIPDVFLGSFPIPVSIALHNYVYPKWLYEKRPAGPVSKVGILRRDRYKCAYCSRSATTIDHVVPRARGGQTTWTNCVAACVKHNSLKGSKTLAEAGLKLWFAPGPPC